MHTVGLGSMVLMMDTDEDFSFPDEMYESFQELCCEL